jgi:hypothetical protein
MNPELILQRLVDILPDNNIGITFIDSQLPENIITSIEELGKSYNAILLINADIFRYSNSKILQNYIAADNRNYFIATLGYENKVIAPRMFELSFPVYYFNRSYGSLCLKKHNLSYGFGCLNNREGFHRLLLGYFLNKAGLLDKMIFTQNLINKWPVGYEQVLLDTLDNFEDYKKLLPIQTNSIVNQNWIHDHNTEHKAYTDTYCNIITESETECFMMDNIFPTPVMSEKSYKPFISCQIPLFLAAQGHLTYLKGLGFEVMEDLLPSGYDEFNTFDKVSAITQIVAQGKDFIENFYFDHLREIKHNHELVSSQNVEELVLNRISEFVSDI